MTRRWIAALLTVLVCAGGCGTEEPPAPGGKEAPDPPVWRLLLSPEGEEAPPEILEQAADVLRERLEDLGLENLAVRVQADRRLRVELPEITRLEVRRVASLLTRLGKLEFRLVAPEDVEEGERRRRAEMGGDYPGPPEGYRWFPPRQGAALGGGPAAGGPPDRLLEAGEDDPWSGEDLDPEELEVRGDHLGPGYVVGFAIREERREEFESFTARSLKRQLAILLDDEIEAAPIIQTPLPGRAQISGGGVGGFSRAEAEDLVHVLRSGRLPVRLVLESMEDLSVR